MIIQSKNYVPGVSGFKIHKDGSIEVNDGPCPFRLEILDKSEPDRSGKNESQSGFDEAMAKGAQAVIDYMASQISETAIVRDEKSARCEDGGKEQIIPMQRKSGDARPFVVIDGAVYINSAMLEAGVSPEQKPSLEEKILEVIKRQLRPGGLLWRTKLGR